MAKLSARGRKELARVSKEKETPEGDLTTWERRTLALMDDGNILEKRDVRFKPIAGLEGSKHSYGWKVLGKAKPGLTPERFVEIYVEKGYAKES